MEYTVQKGDTIAKVTQLLGTDWQTLQRANPAAIGRLKSNGNWFLHEGRSVSVEPKFQDVLAEQVASKHSPKTGVPQGVDGFQAAQKEVLHTIRPGDTVWELAVKRYHVHPEEILSLNNISDPKNLRPGSQLRIPLPEKEGQKEVVASWYGEPFHGKPMANGTPYDMYESTIAHKKMPLGTRVELENPRTGEKVRAVVADRGPYVQGRDVDLSYHLASRLSLVEQGVGSLIMKVL
jgi:rare lipoprotein A